MPTRDNDFEQEHDTHTAPHYLRLELGHTTKTILMHCCKTEQGSNTDGEPVAILDNCIDSQDVRSAGSTNTVMEARSRIRANMETLTFADIKDDHGSGDTSSLSYRLWSWWYKDRLPRCDTLYERAQQGINEDMLSFMEVYDADNFSTNEIPRLAGMIARHVRTVMLITKRDLATVVAVREEIVRYLKKKDVREKDIANLLPMAVNLSFVPSRQEVMAMSMSTSASYLRHARILTHQQHTRGRPWLLNWLGTKSFVPGTAEM